MSKYFFCNITARTHKLACRFFCHLHFAASTKRTGWGWGLTSSVHVKNLAKQLCRSSNSTRGSWISKGGSDCVSLGSVAGGRRKPKIEQFFWVCTFTKLLRSLLRYAFNFQQKCFLGLLGKKYHQNILKQDLVLMVLLRATQWCNLILILILRCKVMAF